MNKELLRMENIVTLADSRLLLDHARLNLFEGEIIGITGVNNAGKTVLAGGISGKYPIDSGCLFLSEKEVRILSIEDGRKAGVYYFSQNSSLIGEFTVWENFLLGPRGKQVVIREKESEEQCHDMLDLLEIHVDIHDRINTLSLKEKLLVEMARAIYYDAKIFIMDNILSTLSATALDEFEAIFEMLCSLHIGIILIESGIRYLKRYCRRLFVMRDRKTVGVLNAGEMDDNLIISLMLGIKSAYVEKEHSAGETADRKVLFEMNEICYKQILDRLSFQIYSGEIAGILNTGKHSGEAIGCLLQGRDRPDSGTISLNGRTLRLKSAEKAVECGIASLAEQDSIIPNLTLEENVMLPALKGNSSFLGIVNNSELKYRAHELISNYIVPYQGILASERRISEDRALRWKISFCRMLSTSPGLVVLNNPTQNMDIAAKEILYQDIRSLKQQNVAGLVISSDIKELLAVSDRILVVSHGRLHGTLYNNEYGREELLYYYGKHLKESL